jgi:hypothetical protein
MTSHGEKVKDSQNPKKINSANRWGEQRKEKL